MLEFIVATCVCLLLLRLSLPREYWRLARQNRYRLDGSVSQVRRKRETVAFRDYLGNLFVPLLLIFLTAFAAATWFFNHVMPSQMIWQSFQVFDWDPSVWRNNLSAIEEQHEEFLKAQDLSAERARDIQRSLWHDWPVLLASLIAVLAVAYWSFVQAAATNAAKLVRGVRTRRQRYARDDVRQMKTVPQKPEQAIPQS